MFHLKVSLSSFSGGPEIIYSLESCSFKSELNHTNFKECFHKSLQSDQINAYSTSLVMHTSSLTFITYRKLTSWLVSRNITAASTQSKFSNEVKRSQNRKKN